MINGKIYKITNKVNGDFYIGETTRTLEQRFYEHKHGTRQSKKKLSRLQLAMEKYGQINFIIELIEENIPTLDRLSEREIYYIEKLKPIYNGTKGGGARNKKKIISNKNNDFVLNKELFRHELGLLSSAEYNLIIRILELSRGEKYFSFEKEEIDIIRDVEYSSPSAIKRFIDKVIHKLNEKCGLILFSGYSISVDGFTYHFIFNDEIYEWLFDSKSNLYKIDVNNIYSLKSVSSKQLYIYLINNGRRRTITISKEEFCEILGNKSLINNRTLVHQFINPSFNSVKNIVKFNKLTPIKRGRKIIAYEFK